jgi:hypothetical protein
VSECIFVRHAVLIDIVQIVDARKRWYTKRLSLRTVFVALVAIQLAAAISISMAVTYVESESIVINLAEQLMQQTVNGIYSRLTVRRAHWVCSGLMGSSGTCAANIPGRTSDGWLDDPSGISGREYDRAVASFGG